MPSRQLFRGIPCSAFLLGAVQACAPAPEPANNLDFALDTPLDALSDSGAAPSDEELVLSTLDADGDGSAASLDCDDADATRYPGAPEEDDLDDDDCDGFVDEDFVAVGDIVISELNRQARFGTAAIVVNGSWVEVKNVSSRTIDLSNWVIARGTAAGHPQVTIDPAAGVVVAPGEYAVFCDTDDYQNSAGVTYPLVCDYVWGDETQASSYRGTYHDNTFTLGRNSDTFSVYTLGSRTTGVLMDRIAWTYDATNGYWPLVVRKTTILDPDFEDITSNDNKSNWCTTTVAANGTTSNDTRWRWYDTSGTSNDEFGTPGADNHHCGGDYDGDGYTTDDCNATDASIHPGAAEVCDGVDQDCDGTIDDGAGSNTFYPDADGDGYGDSGSPMDACTLPSGYTTDDLDCDDTDADVSPDAGEICNDFVDNDCNPDSTCDWVGSKVADSFDDARYAGSAANEAVGSAAALNGDFNGDGWDDVVVGQSYWDVSGKTDVGRVNVLYGPVSGSIAVGGEDLAISGDTTRSGDYFGGAATFVRDVDGDGFDELLVGGARAGASDQGSAWLFAGGGSPTGTADAWATFTSTGANDYVGFGIGGGDVDGDGAEDLVVGAYGRSSGAGYVGVWRGGSVTGGAEDIVTTSSFQIVGATASDALGYSASMAEDLDGDGLGDLVVGAPAQSSSTSTGTAYVFVGIDALTGNVALTSADATIAGSSVASRMGLQVVSLGDVDGDGNADFAASADKDDTSGADAGAVYIFSALPVGEVLASGAASTTVTGVAAGDYLGRTVAAAGDPNADGVRDILMSATAWDTSTVSGVGATYLFYGPVTAGTVSASTYDARFYGSAAYDAVGYALGGGGDVDADGVDDFMMTSMAFDASGLSNSGAAWLYYGMSQ